MTMGAALCVPLESYNPRTVRLTPDSFYEVMGRMLVNVEHGCEPMLMDTFEFLEWLDKASISELEFFAKGPGLRTLEDITCILRRC